MQNDNDTSRQATRERCSAIGMSFLQRSAVESRTEWGHRLMSSKAKDYKNVLLKKEGQKDIVCFDWGNVYLYLLAGNGKTVNASPVPTDESIKKSAHFDNFIRLYLCLPYNVPNAVSIRNFLSHEVSHHQWWMNNYASQTWASTADPPCIAKNRVCPITCLIITTLHTDALSWRQTHAKNKIKKTQPKCCHL